MSEQPTATCPTCGTPAPAGASFCGNCGSALPWGTAPATRPTRPVLSDADVRTWAMGAHLTALAGGFIGGLASFVGPLVIWLIRRDDDPFIAGHALEALNFNLMAFAIVAAGIFFGIITLGLGLLLVVPVLLLLGVVWLIWTIQATLAASRGETYRYPISVRLIS